MIKRKNIFKITKKIKNEILSPLYFTHYTAEALQTPHLVDGQGGEGVQDGEARGGVRFTAQAVQNHWEHLQGKALLLHHLLLQHLTERCSLS